MRSNFGVLTLESWATFRVTSGGGGLGLFCGYPLGQIGDTLGSN